MFLIFGTYKKIKFIKLRLALIFFYFYVVNSFTKKVIFIHKKLMIERRGLGNPSRHGIADKLLHRFSKKQYRQIVKNNFFYYKKLQKKNFSKFFLESKFYKETYRLLFKD